MLPIARWLLVPCACIALALGAAACGDSGGGSTGGGGGGATGWCASGTFTADLQGAPATAVVQFSTAPSFDAASGTFGDYYLQMGGEVTSSVASYLFAADLYGYSGYGDMTDLVYGETFKVYIELFATGFYLTTNPYEGLYSTTYVFTCQ